MQQRCDVLWGTIDAVRRRSISFGTKLRLIRHHVRTVSEQLVLPRYDWGCSTLELHSHLSRAVSTVSLWLAIGSASWDAMTLTLFSAYTRRIRLQVCILI